MKTKAIFTPAAIACFVIIAFNTLSLVEFPDGRQAVVENADLTGIPTYDVR